MKRKIYPEVRLEGKGGYVRHSFFLVRCWLTCSFPFLSEINNIPMNDDHY